MIQASKRTRVTITGISFMLMFCVTAMTGPPAAAQLKESECVEITRIKHPTVLDSNNPNHPGQMWRRYSDDLVKWIGQDLTDINELVDEMEEGTDYFFLGMNVWFRNSCAHAVSIRPSIFVFRDGVILPAWRPETYPEVSGPGIFEPYWLRISPEVDGFGEKSLCTYWYDGDWNSATKTFEGGELRHPDCVVAITAASYSPDATYHVGLSGYECDINVGDYSHVETSDRRCGVPEPRFPADPPDRALQIVAPASNAVGQGAERQTAGEEVLTREQRIQVQRGLIATGFNAGTPDGVFGVLTRSAIWDWQQATDVEPTGYLTKEQMQTLMVAGEKAQ